MDQESFKEYNFTLTPVTPFTDLLIAELGTVGFESFMETETGVLAYINSEIWSEDCIEGLSMLENPLVSISFEISTVMQENWNSEWEKNFSPITVEGRCCVRAPFHEKQEVDYDIVILPKMSFGTGHHETTHMMLSHILENEFTGKSVLDMGSGTGVLAILAAYRGASSIDAIDIDRWCYENALENVQRNNCEHIQVIEGDASVIVKNYDVIIANINRNILLEDMEVYVAHLNPGGSLFLSGFYQEDIPVIQEKCESLGLDLKGVKEKNNWVSLKFVF